MTKKRYAQVGTGGRARFFYRAVVRDYADTSEIVAFCDVNQTRMDYCNEQLVQYGGKKVPTYKHYEFDKMIEETKPDCVIVTSVDRTHDEYIIRAMELGCDVVTEKPMTIDPQRINAILEAEKQGLITIVRYGQMTDRMRQWNYRTILEEYEKAEDHPEYRHFLKGNFPGLFG